MSGELTESEFVRDLYRFTGCRRFVRVAGFGLGNLWGAEQKPER